MFMDETEPTPPPIADYLPASFSDDDDYVMGMAEDDDNDNDGSLQDPLLQPPASASRPFEAKDKCFSDRASYMLEVLSAYRSTTSAGRLSPEQQAEHLEDRQQVEEVLKRMCKRFKFFGDGTLPPMPQEMYLGNHRQQQFRSAQARPLRGSLEHGENRRVQSGTEQRSESTQNLSAVGLPPMPEPHNGMQRTLLNAQANRNLQSRGKTFQTFTERPEAQEAMARGMYEE